MTRAPIASAGRLVARVGGLDRAVQRQTSSGARRENHPGGHPCAHPGATYTAYTLSLVAVALRTASAEYFVLVGIGLNGVKARVERV